MYKRGPSTGIKCPAITQKGNPCPIDGEDFRNGWCHVHDPNGKSREHINHRRKFKEARVNLKTVSRDKNLREAIAKDLESMCHLSMECTCEWHRAADIARFGL